MYVIAVQIGVLLMLLFHPPSRAATARQNNKGETPATQSATQPPSTSALAKQLFAVRGEVTKLEVQSKGLVAITVRPPHDTATVTVVARENDIVGAAATSKNSSDLVGLLSGDDQRESERITAAEIREGDLVSIIYDPTAQNRALEIYIH